MSNLNGYVVDVSVVVKWFLNEKATDPAHEVLGQLSLFYMPGIFWVEIDSLLTKYVRRKKLAIAESRKKHKLFRMLPYILIGYTDIEEFAFCLVTEFAITIYDACCLATGI